MSEYAISFVLVAIIIVAMGAIFYSLRQQKTVALGVSVLSGLFIGVLYYQFGGYRLQQEHLRTARRMEEVKAVLSTMRSSEELIEKLKEKIKQDDANPKGWYLLGRLEASLGHQKPSYLAFKEAYNRNPNDTAIVINYAQSYMVLHQNRLNDKMRTLVMGVLQSNPSEPNALSMLAMDAYLAHHFEQAIAYWQALLKLVPAGSEDAKLITEAIAKANKQLPR